MKLKKKKGEREMGKLTQYEKLTRLVGKGLADEMCLTPLQPPPESEWEAEFTELFGPDWRGTLFSPEWREFLLKEGEVKEVGIPPKEGKRQDVPSSGSESEEKDVPNSGSESDEEMSQGDKSLMRMADDNLMELLHPSIRALVEKLKEKISSLQAAVKQKDEEILNLKHKASKKSSPGSESISALHSGLQVLRSLSSVYDNNKSVDGTRSWMPKTEVALREELEKAQSQIKVMASQHKENSSLISASLSVKSSDPSSGISEQVASLREGLDRLTNEVRAYANKENSSTDSSSQDVSNQSSKTASSADWFEGINDLQMRSLLCRKDSYEFGKTKKILSWQRDISISWNAFRSEPTRWSSSFDPKYFSDPSKFDDPRTPEGPTSRTSRDILVTSKYSKPPSKSTKKNNNKNNFTNFI